eukprot:5315993-Alexandrium_andersonii.AAC.1
MPWISAARLDRQTWLMAVPRDERERTRLALQVAEVAHGDQEAALRTAVGRRPRRRGACGWGAP